MRRYLFLLCFVFAGCVVDPSLPDDVVDPDDGRVVVPATIDGAFDAYEATLRKSYLIAADKLESGAWTTDQQYRDGFAELHKDARKAAMQSLADREQRETAGVDDDGKPLWTPQKTAEYLRTIAGEDQ